MCGDSTHKDDIMRLMNNQDADMLLTDPPYNVDYVGKTAEALKKKMTIWMTISFMNF